MLRDSTLVVAVTVVRTRPRAILLPMTTMTKSIHGFLFPYVVMGLRFWRPPELSYNFRSWGGRRPPPPAPLVHASATVNFAQIVKKATCLTTKTQYNSNNSHTPEFKRTSFRKKEIIWMNSLTFRPRLKKGLWCKFPLGPNIRTLRKT